MSNVRKKNLKNLKLFGENLRKIRLEKNLTQEQLAFKAGISNNSMNRIEGGSLNTTVATICELAKVLKVKPRDLMDF